MTAIPPLPLHLTSLAILSPANSPLYVHSFTSKSDELRHYHLSHAAVDVIEERILMTSTPTKPADSYLGLLFCMEDMAFYGFQTHTRIRMVLSVALVDALIKDGDIVAIFRAVQQLLLQAVHNPFLSLPTSFTANPATAPETLDESLSPATTSPDDEVKPTERLDQQSDARKVNTPTPTSKMFATSPEDIQPGWLEGSGRFKRGIKRLGQVLNGGR